MGRVLAASAFWLWASVVGAATLPSSDTDLWADAVVPPLVPFTLDIAAMPAGDCCSFGDLPDWTTGTQLALLALTLAIFLAPAMRRPPLRSAGRQDVT